MSYVDFESDGVEYRLILSRHNSKRKEPIDGLDALVVESGSMYQGDYYAYNLTNNPELSNYLEEIANREIPVYSVDNKGRSLLLNTATIMGHFYAPFPMVYGISRLAGADDHTANYITLGTLWAELAIIALPAFLGNGISKFFAKVNSVLSLLRQSPREELRNALTARKIKKGIVPHLTEQYPERFDSRKPKIGIIYGAAHSGIKECLESDLRSSVSLGLHRYYGLRFILDRKTLRDFYEYRLDKGGNVTYQRLQVESI